MSQTQPRPSDASTLQGSQLDWMTESQRAHLAQEHSLSRDSGSGEPVGHTTNTNSDAFSNRNSTAPPQPAQPQPNPTALAHSLPPSDQTSSSSRSQSFMMHTLVNLPERRSGSHLLDEDEFQDSPALPPHRQQNQQLAAAAETTFADLDDRPQSTAPPPQNLQNQPRADHLDLSFDGPSHEDEDDGGSRSMELTNLNSGKPASRPLPNSSSRHHESLKSAASSSQNQTQSQSDADQPTQRMPSPELPPMAESTRHSRPQFGRMCFLSAVVQAAMRVDPAFKWFCHSEQDCLQPRQT